MATEIPCEKMGKQIKLRFVNRDKLGIDTLNEEIIIGSNGPSLSDLDTFIFRSSEIFLQKIQRTNNIKYQI